MLDLWPSPSHEGQVEILLCHEYCHFYLSDLYLIPLILVAISKGCPVVGIPVWVVLLLTSYLKFTVNVWASGWQAIFLISILVSVLWGTSLNQVLRIWDTCTQIVAWAKILKVPKHGVVKTCLWLKSYNSFLDKNLFESYPPFSSIDV